MRCQLHTKLGLFGGSGPVFVSVGIRELIGGKCIARSVGSGAEPAAPEWSLALLTAIPPTWRSLTWKCGGAWFILGAPCSVRWRNSFSRMLDLRTSGLVSACISVVKRRRRILRPGSSNCLNALSRP